MNNESELRRSPLDEVKEVSTATGMLRDTDGKLSASSVAKLYGVRFNQLAEWLGHHPQSASRSLDDLVQSELSYFERVARLLSVISEEDFRKWLRTPNTNLQNECPIDWITERRWQPLADLVDDMLSGAPG